MEKKFVLEIFDAMEQDLKNNAKKLSIATGTYGDQRYQDIFIDAKTAFNILLVARNLIEKSS